MAAIAPTGRSRLSSLTEATKRVEIPLTPDEQRYQTQLSRWRYSLRCRLISIVRAETPALAWLQRTFRSPAADVFFKMSANLGTHTFFMVMLPLCMWTGHVDTGVSLTHMLGLGVFVSGVFKDLFCLPRPQSPPLERLTMSGTVSLEYGFPSTHSTNAISVIVYVLHALAQNPPENSSLVWAAYLAAGLYGFSIMFGRLYCGMHGFLDVLTGSLLGWAVGLTEIWYGNQLEGWIRESPSWWPVALVCLIAIVSVRLHPRPLDDCPCVDDSISFAGVLMGIKVGAWHLWQLAQPGREIERSLTAKAGPSRLGQYAQNAILDASTVGRLDVPTTIARITLGVGIIFVWRAGMKAAVGYLVEFLSSRSERRDKKDVDLALAEFAAQISQAGGFDDQLDLAGELRQRKSPLDLTPTRKNESGSEASDSTVAADWIATTGSSMSDTDTVVALGGTTSQMQFNAEIVNRLIVYFGIAWLAIEGNPMLFQFLGLTG